ncbi:MAG: rhodanese-like domain-containing protein [Bacteroidales bacterium]|nr:rhodanese-like domain-containing protein [Bacteroidales bacterium]
MDKISNNKDVIIVSGRTPADYKKRHIPNSVNLNHKDLYIA